MENKFDYLYELYNKQDKEKGFIKLVELYKENRHIIYEMHYKNLEENKKYRVTILVKQGISVEFGQIL